MRSALAAGLLVAALAGCAQNQPAGSAQREVVFLASGLRAPFAVQMSEGFRFGAAQVPGITARVSAPDAVDPVQQVKLMQQEVAAGPRSLSLSIPFGEHNEDPIGAAAEKGVQLIAVDTPPPPGSPVRLFIGNDNHDLGRLLADTVADKLGPGATGKILLGSPRNGVAQLDARALGFRERMRERLPKVRVVGPLDTSDKPDAAARLWESVAKANPDAIALASVGASAALLADLRQRRHGSWLAASFDVEPQALPAVKRGELVLISPEHFLKGAVAGRLQAEYSGREKDLPAGWLQLPGIAVTEKNADEFIARSASPGSGDAWYAARLDEILGAGDPQVRPMEDAQ